MGHIHRRLGPQATGGGAVTRFLAALFHNALIVFTRLVTAVRADWRGCAPEPIQRIYYANHASHGDFALVWTVMPPTLRRKTRPVAGADYWLATRIHRFIALKIFRAVLIDRQRPQRCRDPLEHIRFRRNILH